MVWKGKMGRRGDEMRREEKVAVLELILGAAHICSI